MRITTQAEYGLICALHLARRMSDGPVTGREIATRERLPADYVEQIMLKLRRAGIVTSTRGAHGGYHRARRDLGVGAFHVRRALRHPSRRGGTVRGVVWMQHPTGLGAAPAEDRRS